MRVITLEDHFTTKLHNTTIPPVKDPNSLYNRIEIAKERSKELGHDIDRELMDMGSSRIAAMDAAGVDLQVISLTTPGCQPLEPEQSVRVAQDANDQLYEAIQKYPTKFAGFSALPTPNPEAASEELKRGITKLGFKGALINSHTHGEFLDDKKYWTIFETAQSLDVPIYLHPAAPHPAAMQSYFGGFEDLARPAWGFSVDASTHFLRILFGGVFDSFPKLKIILGHLGEGLPFGLQRLNDHTINAARNRKLKRTPVEYFKENLVVTTSGNFSIPSFMCTVEILGIENVLFSIDWPYESNRVGSKFLDDLPLSDAQKEQVAYKNAERVLRL
jgi:predicted TIM-barrel fold metal-dependent hydrolase